MHDSSGAEPATDEDLGASLMRRIRDGDAEAFTDLVERYQRSVMNAVYRYTGNRATAEELTQDVFVRIYKARASYERKAKFETWLYRIVFNLCANAADYGRRRRATSLDQTTDDGESRGASLVDPDREEPSRSIEREEARLAVREAIAQLPDQQRAALVLSRFGGRPYQEIADSLDTTVEAVKSLLFRARENLRASLGPRLQLGAHEERLEDERT